MKAEGHAGPWKKEKPTTQMQPLGNNLDPEEVYAGRRAGVVSSELHLRRWVFFKFFLSQTERSYRGRVLLRGASPQQAIG